MGLSPWPLAPSRHVGGQPSQHVGEVTILAAQPLTNKGVEIIGRVIGCILENKCQSISGLQSGEQSGHSGAILCPTQRTAITCGVDDVDDCDCVNLCGLGHCLGPFCVCPSDVLDDTRTQAAQVRGWTISCVFTDVTQLPIAAHVSCETLAEWETGPSFGPIDSPPKPCQSLGRARRLA